MFSFTDFHWIPTENSTCLLGPYTSLQRLTIEALDCVIKPPSYDSQGHLHIFIEPRIPVESVQRNADPLLSQIIDQQKDIPLTPQTDISQLTLLDTMPSPLSIPEDIDHSPLFFTIKY